MQLPHEFNGSLVEKTVSTRHLFQGELISLQVDTVELPNGSTSQREIVKHPGAVGIVALVDDKLIVVEQYRKALERTLVEIPAGKIDPGESPEKTAIRELKEETGYTCRQAVPLCSYYTSPGFANEIIHIYRADDLRKGQSSPDEDEFLRCGAITFEQAQQYVKDGRICDAKTVTAVHAWELYRLRGVWP